MLCKHGMITFHIYNVETGGRPQYEMDQFEPGMVLLGFFWKVTECKCIK